MAVLCRPGARCPRVPVGVAYGSGPGSPPGEPAAGLAGPRSRRAASGRQSDLAGGLGQGGLGDSSSSLHGPRPGGEPARLRRVCVACVCARPSVSTYPSNLSVYSRVCRPRRGLRGAGWGRAPSPPSAPGWGPASPSAEDDVLEVVLDDGVGRGVEHRHWMLLVSVAQVKCE